MRVLVVVPGAWALAGAVGLVACGTSRRDVPLVPTDNGNKIDLGVGPPIPEHFVAVVDDQASAGDLRATVARTFDQMDAIQRADSGACAPPYDPAAFHPIDHSLVVVHPSGSGNGRYTSELDDPALHWRSEQQTQADHDAWSAAVIRALEPKPSASGPFAPLAGFERAASLVAGGREPENDEEASIIGSYEPFPLTTLLVALGHEDASAGDAASYATELGSSAYLVTVVLPSLTPDPQAACFDALTVTGQTSQRYASWLAAQGYDPGEVGHWPCADPNFYHGLSDGCAARCLAWTPVTDTDGTAACEIMVDTSADACDEAHGWLDPVSSSGERKPKMVHDANGDHRVCEMRQLTGAALASCVTSLECPDCEPGWCVTDVPELFGSCSEGYPLNFRFVGGSDRAANGIAHIHCDAPSAD